MSPSSSPSRLDPGDGDKLQVDGAILLEALQSLHKRGVALEQALSDDDARLLRATVLFQEDDDDDEPCTAGAWFATIKQNARSMVPQEAQELQALHERWQLDEERHARCKGSLSRSLFLRLLAFISDLVDYRDSLDAQERMDVLLPTAADLFNSPLYFPDQPGEGRLLMSFVAPNGLTISQTMSTQFERSPRLEGVCTAHTLAPLLKRLFAIDDNSFCCKQFKEFRSEFNRAASTRLRLPPPMRNCAANMNQAAHRRSLKQQSEQKGKHKTKGKQRG